MTERRFHEDEVAAIFERASNVPPADARARLASEGITLAQLQEIGREVGIAPEAISQAVAALDQRGAATSRRLLGIPIGVGHVVDLPRKLTDDEWERVVVDLRETFDARGVMRAEGSMRQWTNGNLHVLLEPTAAGQRLRLRTVKGTARSAIVAGAAILGYIAVGILVEATNGDGFDLQGALPAITVGLLGLSVIGAWLTRLPAWARTRREQMDAIAVRLAASLAPGGHRDEDSAGSK